MSLPQSLIAQFRKPSGLFGRLAGSIMASRASNRQRNAWTVALIAPRAGERVLEWGCGPGVGLLACHALAPEANLTAIDHSDTMVDMARKRCRELAEAGTARIERGALEHALAFAPFDAIFSCNVLQFSDDRARDIALFHELLKPGGRVATTYQPRTGYDRKAAAERWGAEVCAAHEVAGFAEVSLHRLDRFETPAVCVLARRGLSS